HTDLQSAISFLQGEGAHIVLDNYEAAGSLPQLLPESSTSAVIALGAERGWSPAERDTFRRNGWKLAHLGAHILRLETACVAAVAAVSSSLDLYDTQTSTVL
ncbi:MAG: RsmE family RNA methyltransferase, partial [Verrucomicrobiota bacterium]|nr:RsmE family RNA methyltransferase [Verrucomicrobiota bacterium]